jgi:hypothetical protein
MKPCCNNRAQPTHEQRLAFKQASTQTLLPPNFDLPTLSASICSRRKSGAAGDKQVVLAASCSPDNTPHLAVVDQHMLPEALDGNKHPKRLYGLDQPLVN